MYTILVYKIIKVQKCLKTKIINKDIIQTKHCRIKSRHLIYIFEFDFFLLLNCSYKQIEKYFLSVYIKLKLKEIIVYNDYINR